MTIKGFSLSIIVFLGFSMTSIDAEAYRNDDQYVISKCRIIEILRRGQRESNKYIIRGYNKRGKVLETFRAFDGMPFMGRSEAELGLFLLVEEGSCPP